MKNEDVKTFKTSFAQSVFLKNFQATPQNIQLTHFIILHS